MFCRMSRLSLFLVRFQLSKTKALKEAVLNNFSLSAPLAYILSANNRIDSSSTSHFGVNQEGMARNFSNI